MIHTFGDVWGYSVFFRRIKSNGKQKNELLKPKPNGLTREDFKKHCKCKKKFRYKEKWTSHEIYLFCDDVKKTLTTGKEHDRMYDGLLFALSCHGQDANIIDSENKLYPLQSLFEHFQSEQMTYFVDEPKLFFLDVCRPTLQHGVNNYGLKLNSRGGRTRKFWKNLFKFTRLCCDGR